MTTGRPFRLGYNTNSWGRTPDLDAMLGDIAGAGLDVFEGEPAVPDELIAMGMRVVDNLTAFFAGQVPEDKLV